MKRSFYTSVFIAGIIVLALSILSAQSDKMVLNNKDTFKVKERPPVEFPHGLHMEGELECTDCHHFYRNGKNVLDESTLEEGNSRIKCSNCHRRKKIRRRYNLRDAFHLQCMGCHGKLKKVGKKTGPGLCGECHPWK